MRVSPETDPHLLFIPSSPSALSLHTTPPVPDPTFCQSVPASMENPFLQGLQDLRTFHFSFLPSSFSPRGDREGVSPSSFSLHPSPLGETERGLLILILSPILFRHFQKLSKLLYPLCFHLPSIQYFPIRLQPIQHISILCHILRRIPMLTFNELLHFIIPIQPTCLLIYNHESLTINHEPSVFHRSSCVIFLLEQSLFLLQHRVLKKSNSE